MGHVKTSCAKQKCVAEGSSSACEVIEDHICVHSIEFVDGDSLVDDVSYVDNPKFGDSERKGTLGGAQIVNHH